MVVGILIGIIIALCFIGTFYLGYNYNIEEVKEFDDKEKREKEIKELEEERLRAKLRDEGFQNIMDYDIDVALGRRGINEWNVERMETIWSR